MENGNGDIMTRLRDLGMSSSSASSPVSSARQGYLSSYEYIYIYIYVDARYFAISDDGGFPRVELMRGWFRGFGGVVAESRCRP